MASALVAPLTSAHHFSDTQSAQPQERNTSARFLDSRQEKDVTADVVFLDRQPRYENVKPFRLNYEPGPGIERSNCIFKASSVVIKDLRSSQRTTSYETNGFELAQMATKLTPEEFFDHDCVVNVYLQELETLLMNRFKPKEVKMIEHIVRRRHAGFPVSTGQDYEYLNPTSIVHVDFTEDSALEISGIAGMDNNAFDRIECVNVWKPLRGPVTDWPLTFCDGTTTSPERDFEAMDVVTRTGYTENYQVYYHPEQQWYYYSHQSADELILFRQSDTREGYPGLPHTGFNNPLRIEGEVPRESIEVRAFMYF